MTQVLAEASQVDDRQSQRIPALDGIRALAVLAVMLFHTDSSWLRAGFLGVDVFFVLSGFLIVNVLLEYLSTVGTGAMVRQFWLRRARRLGPALLALVAVVAVARLLSPGPGDSNSAPIMAALTYTTNWYQIATSGTYFDQFGAPSVLEHTWSLAIEEQFYVFFPWLLIAILALAGGIRRQRIAGWLAGASLLSAGWTLWLSLIGASEDRIYMGTDTRVQGLLLGAALGAALGARKRGGPGPAWVAWSGVGGLLLLSASAAFVPVTSVLYRGGFMVVALATAGVIASAMWSSPLSRVLGWRPLAGLGLISYSVYLWHYPVFAWIQWRDPREASVGAQVWCMALTIGLAYVSYRWIEQAILRGAFSTWPVARQWLSYALATGLVAIVACLPAGAFERREEMSWPAGESLPKNFLIMGDSTALGLDMFFPRDRYPGVRTGGTYRIGCSFSRLAFRTHLGVMPVDTCQDWSSRTEEYIRTNHPDAVVIQDHAWVTFDRVVGDQDFPPGSHVFDRDFKASLAEAIRVGGSGGDRPVFVVKVGCMWTPGLPGTALDSARVAHVNALIDEVVRASPRSSSVESAPLTCRNGLPVEAVGDPGLRDDGVHWTQKGAESMWNRIVHEVRRSGVESQ